MESHLFWFSDEQWAKIEPHRPTNQPGPERCFGRLKDFRRIATRYDKLAGNFLSALCLVAFVAYWL
jgi:transposase